MLYGIECYRMLSGAYRCKGNENVKIDKQKYIKG